MAPRIKVAQGVLEGRETVTYYGKKYFSFEGIPYAKPPIGKLRFRNPEPPENWTGIRDATKPGNKCCQLNPYSNTSLEGSEDCLYLNVYTPCLPYEKIKELPVLFFIHGGRLIFGYGDYYRPDYLMKYDVILVTVNYRLNILGFMCLDIPEAPGNSGPKDTILALRWVKENIAKFNGNPGNVTVIGESAGAGIVTSYLTSKMADGLFHKVIAQSGTATSDLFMVNEDHIQKARVVVSNLGKDLTDPRSLYEFLIDCPIEDLLIAFSMAEVGRHPGIINAYLLPVVEKPFDNVERYLDEYPRIDIMNNKFKKVPVMLGQNSHEGAFIVRKDSEGNVIFQKELFYCIPRYLNIKQGSQKALDIEKRIREFYFKNEEINNSTLSEYVDLLTDAYFYMDLTFFAEHIAKYSNRIYNCKFEYFGNLNLSVMQRLGLKGASHGDMIQYQFYREKKHQKCSENDKKIIRFLIETLCSFAKNGEPMWSEQKAKWLPYTCDDRHVLTIDKQIELKKNIDSERLKFWKSIVGEKCKL